MRKWISLHASQSDGFNSLLAMRTVQVVGVRRDKHGLFNFNCFLSSCRARLRTRLENNEQYMTDKNFDDTSQKVEIVCDQHNHDIITERRKKGSLQELRRSKQSQQQEIIEEVLSESENLE